MQRRLAEVKTEITDMEQDVEHYRLSAIFHFAVYLSENYCVEM